MIAHTQRAGSLGAKMTAITAVLAALAVAAWEGGVAATGDWPKFVEIAVTHVPIGLLGGALLGAILFGLIGFVVALLGVKRLGWTFTYTILGAVLFAFAAYWLQPLIESVSNTFTGPSGIGAAVALTALIGAISGYLVAGALKDAPDV